MPIIGRSSAHVGTSDPVALTRVGVEAMSWTGADGSFWDLLHGQVIVQRVRGLHLPSWDHQRSARAGLPGTRYTGSRVTERPVSWTVLLDAGPVDDFVALDDAWWRSLSVEDQGVWAVTAKGRTRSLRLRLDAGDDTYTQDPIQDGWAIYSLGLVPDQPLWEGPAISRVFVTDAPASWLPTSGAVFFFSASNTLAAAALDNPGDVPAYPTWRLTGPFATAAVGVGTAQITVPFALTAGHWLDIDTQALTAVDDLGADRIADLGTVEVAPVPPGESVPLSVSATGTGAGMSATATITPLYHRAWGR